MIMRLSVKKKRRIRKMKCFAKTAALVILLIASSLLIKLLFGNKKTAYVPLELK